MFEDPELAEGMLNEGDGLATSGGDSVVVAVEVDGVVVIDAPGEVQTDPGLRSLPNEPFTIGRRWNKKGGQRMSRFSFLLRIFVSGLASTVCGMHAARGEPVTEQWTGSGGLPILYLIGDSTVNNGTKGLQGWGTPIADFFDKGKIVVANNARGGRSSRTYFTEGLWEKVRAGLRPGDFVLIQFGHNDNGPVAGEFSPGRAARSSIPGNGEETKDVTAADGKKETVHTFGWYLRKYAADTKSKGATAIILSPVPRNDWKGGKVLRTDPHVKWAAEAAMMADVPFVDLNTLVANRYDALGQEKVKPFFPQEHTHTGPAGARLNAECVVEGLRALRNSPLAPFIAPVPAGK